MQTTRSATLLSLILIAAPLRAQEHKPSYADLTLVRNRTWAKQNFLEVRAGAIAGLAGDQDTPRFVEDEFGPQGHVYLRKEGAFGREGRLDAYVGTDGIYAGLTEGNPTTAKGYSRLEIFARQWGHFVREGFYASDDFVPVGLYESRDWRARLSFATQMSPTLKAEIAGFYGQHDFERNSQTDPNFTIPDDYSSYGVTLIFEDNRVQIDRNTLLPYQGYLVTAWITREWNDSERRFGITGRESRLPSAVLRGGAHLEWYLPYTNMLTFIVSGDAGIGPDDDRVWIYTATNKPVGEIFVDGRLDLRFVLSDLFTVTPGVRAQWIQIADQFASSEETELFFGAQVGLRADFSESLALTLDYSYLTNESRRPVSLSRDTLGQHRVFFGFEFRP